MTRLAPRLAVLLLLATGAAQAQSAPEGAEWAETVRIRAQVLTVDSVAGQILLRDLATREVFVHEPPGGGTGVLGVQSGDVVAASFTLGVTVRRAAATDPRITETELLSVPARSAGHRGFLGGMLTRSVITLTGWDAEAGVARGITPEGEALAYQVQTDAGRAFLAAQPLGTRLEVEVSETVAVVKE